MNLDHLDWPFFDDAHRTLGRELSAWVAQQAIEAEAQAQALCMLTQDFTRAYEAFAGKQKPVFKGD